MKLNYLLFLASLGLCCGGSAEPPLGVEVTRQSTAWTLRLHDQNVMVYSFAPGTFKPYVKELCTVRGQNLLRDAPSDHLHHHALMYGIAVNGVDFWTETPGCGVQKAIKTTKPEITTTAEGKPQATFTQTIHWVTPQDAFLPDSAKVALLIEQRTLTLILDEAAGETALHWTSTFEVGGKTNQVTLSGANYFGLGMRFLPELDPLAKHVNSGNTPDLSDSKQDVATGDWASVSFDVPGKPATLVIYGHPNNPGGAAHFFTMKTPFAYVSATQGLEKESRVYRAGETFKLAYTVLVYPELKSPKFISARVKSDSESAHSK